MLFSKKFIASIYLFFSIYSFFYIKSYSADIKACKADLNNTNNLGNYLLGPGDLVNIDVFSNSKFTNDYEILNDGTVSLPIVGSVKIDGLSITQATSKLENILDKELYSAALDITLKSSRPLSVSVIGQVNRPGVHKLQKNKFNISNINPYSSLPRLIDALEKAGGISKDADIRNICIIRKRSNIKDDNYYLKFNLLDLLETGQQKNNPYLFDEDIIKVSKLSENTKLDNKEFLKSTFASEYISVNVLGDVRSPGKKKVKNNAYLVDAISEAEGIEFKNSKAFVEILRLENNGKIKRIRHKLNLRVENQNIQIFDKDTIFISSNKIRNNASFIKTLAEPIYYLFRIVEINKIIN